MEDEFSKSSSLNREILVTVWVVDDFVLYVLRVCFGYEIFLIFKESWWLSLDDEFSKSSLLNEKNGSNMHGR